MAGHLDLGTIGYDLVLQKDGTWTSGVTNAENDLRQLGAAMKHNDQIMEKLQKEMFDTAVALREVERTAGAGSDEYKKLSKHLEELERDYHEAETATEQFRREQERVTAQHGLTAEGLTNVGGAVKDVGSQMTIIGGVLTASVTAPIVAAGKAAINTGIEFESSFAEVKKSVGGTNEELEVLRDQILAASEVHPISAAAIAEVYAMGGQLGVASDQLKGFSDVAIGMSVATNLSLEEGASQVAKFSNIMGTATREGVEGYEKLASTLVELGNNGASTEADIMDMAMRIAGSATQVGMTEAQVLGLANALSSMGLESQMGGTAISKTMTEIDKAVALNSDSLKIWADTAGMSVKNFSDLWKNDAASALQAVMKGMGDVKDEGGNLNVLLDELGITEIRQSDTMKRLSGASDLMTESIAIGTKAWEDNLAMQREVDARYETTGVKIEVLKNRIALAGMDVADVLLPILEKFMGYVEKVVAWFRELEPGQQKWVIGLLAAAAAMGPLLVLLGGFVVVIGNIITAIGFIAGAGGIGAVVSSIASVAAPIIGVVAAIAAIVAGFVLLWNHSANFRDFWLELWENIKSAAVTVYEGGIKPVIENISNTIGQMKYRLEPAMDGFKRAWESIKPIIEAVAAVIGLVVMVVLGVVMGLVNGLVEAFAWIARAFAGVIEFVSGVVAAIVALFTGDFDGAWEHLKTAGQGIYDFFAGIFEAIGGLVSGFVQGVIDFFTGLWDELVGHSIVPDMVNAILEWFTTLVNTGTEFISNLVTGIVTWFLSLANQVLNSVNALVTKVLAFFGSLPERVYAALANFVASAMRVFHDLTANVGTWALEMIDKVKGIGSDIVAGIRSGIANAWNGFISWVLRKFDALPEAVRKFLQIESPSRLFSNMFEQVPAGMAQGFTKGMPSLMDTVRSALGQLVDSSSGIVATMTVDSAMTPALAAVGPAPVVNHYNLGDVAIDAASISEIQDVNDFFDNLVRLKRMG